MRTYVRKLPKILLMALFLAYIAIIVGSVSVLEWMIGHPLGKGLFDKGLFTRQNTPLIVILASMFIVSVVGKIYRVKQKEKRE